ncbi:FAD/NAD(P)-binding domain-containing protein [Gonapodya prolifera JEL478]|uniref:FAD/NAD(P)-binding domain-containing protein n=1 Tax=Gonapodya prolifera (strain JEL478) TaxID=1344416 RepID=A0A139AMJ0_GONPJ|nr:FAD/NAD(P)-binding domain-containing protein [Gonapodya prolifera JEL478]|eukprot:KXS17743.1 FAD/NAD(P)-binding domain-containing protein [Gonapodya prolifera JEL478]
MSRMDHRNNRRKTWISRVSQYVDSSAGRISLTIALISIIGLYLYGREIRNKIAGVPTPSVVFRDKKRRRVLIIGGGYAGLLLAKALHHKLRDAPVHIEVLEARDKFYHNVASCRAVTEPGFGKQLWIPYDRFPVFVRRNCQVTDVHTNYVVTATNEEIPFDYLVLATGSINSIPSKFPITTASSQAVATLGRIQRSVAEAQHILIIGGGAAGCEIAGDIVDRYPSKRITIVEALATLLPGRAVTDEMRKVVTEKLARRAVEIVTGARVLLEDEEFELSGAGFPEPRRRVLFTDSGMALDSDLQIVCSGNLHYNGHCLQKLAHTHPTILDEHTHEVCVRKTLQLYDPMLPHIFAIGDVANCITSKTIVACEIQAKVAVQNLLVLLNAEFESGVGRDDLPARLKALVQVEPLQEFGVPGPLLFITLGRSDGAAQLPFLGVLGGWFMRRLKSQDGMTASWWRQLGYDNVLSNT